MAYKLKEKTYLLPCGLLNFTSPVVAAQTQFTA